MFLKIWNSPGLQTFLAAWGCEVDLDFCERVMACWGGQTTISDVHPESALLSSAGSLCCESRIFHGDPQSPIPPTFSLEYVPEVGDSGPNFRIELWENPEDRYVPPGADFHDLDEEFDDEEANGSDDETDGGEEDSEPSLPASALEGPILLNMALSWSRRSLPWDQTRNALIAMGYTNVPDDLTTLPESEEPIDGYDSDEPNYVATLIFNADPGDGADLGASGGPKIEIEVWFDDPLPPPEM